MTDVDPDLPVEICWRDDSCKSGEWMGRVRIVDAATGEDLTAEPIWRANVAEGWYDRYVLMPGGKSGSGFHVDPETGEVATERMVRNIRFVFPDDDDDES